MIPTIAVLALAGFAAFHQAPAGPATAHAPALPDELLVVLVGDMITDEALPSYPIAPNQLLHDREGISTARWARWLRG